MTLILVSVSAIIFFAIALFLGSEFLKKFGFMRSFIECSNQLVEWEYSGDRKPGMYNIVMRGNAPFCALIGFRLNIPILKYSGFDYYGFVKSGENNVAVISTYLGKGACKFQFFANSDVTINQITATSSEEDQLLQPHSKNTPHWYQRFGFYG